MSVNVVSDHAVLRYLERVAGVDVAAIRTEIMEAVKRSQGAPIVRVGDVRYVIRGEAVVSVLGTGQMPRYMVTARCARINAGLPEE